MSKSDWTPCDVCETEVPDGLLEAGDYFDYELSVCVSCRGALSSLARHGIEDVDREKFVEATKKAREKLGEDGDAARRTLNPSEVIAAIYRADLSG